jgi:hypothetical protein
MKALLNCELLATFLAVFRKKADMAAKCGGAEYPESKTTPQAVRVGTCNPSTVNPTVRGPQSAQDVE